jgi:nucleoid DNA-binding protein
MDKLELIKTIAEKMDTTQIESKKFLDALSEIFQETIINDDEISVPGFGKLYTVPIPEKNGFDLKGNPTIFKKTKRAVFRVSQTWKTKL